MVSPGVRRSFVTTVVGLACAISSGCGFIFTHAPPENYEQLDYFSCTETNTGPILDVVWGGLNLLGALAAAANPDAYDNSSQIIAVGFMWTAISGSAALVGFEKTAKCRDAKWVTSDPAAVTSNEPEPTRQELPPSVAAPAVTRVPPPVQPAPKTEPAQPAPDLIRGAWKPVNPAPGVLETDLERWVGTIESGDATGVPKITVRLYEWADVGSDMGTAVYWHDSGACTYALTLVAIEGGERTVRQVSESPRCIPLGDIMFATTDDALVGIWHHADGTHWFSSLLEIR